MLAAWDLHHLSYLWGHRLSILLQCLGYLFPCLLLSFKKNLKNNHRDLFFEQDVQVILLTVFFSECQAEVIEKKTKIIKFKSQRDKGLWQLTSHVILIAKTIRWPWIQNFWYFIEKDEENHVSIIYVTFYISLEGFNKDKWVKIYERIWKLLILLTSHHLSHNVQGQEVIYSVWDYTGKLLVQSTKTRCRYLLAE